jgi:hypothetical protein
MSRFEAGYGCDGLVREKLKLSGTIGKEGKLGTLEAAALAPCGREVPPAKLLSAGSEE